MLAWCRSKHRYRELANGQRGAPSPCSQTTRHDLCIFGLLIVNHKRWAAHSGGSQRRRNRKLAACDVMTGLLSKQTPRKRRNSLLGRFLWDLAQRRTQCWLWGETSGTLLALLGVHSRSCLRVACRCATSKSASFSCSCAQRQPGCCYVVCGGRHILLHPEEQPTRLAVQRLHRSPQHGCARRRVGVLFVHGAVMGRTSASN